MSRQYPLLIFVRTFPIHSVGILMVHKCPTLLTDIFGADNTLGVKYQRTGRNLLLIAKVHDLDHHYRFT